jgi:hypothetical protein
MMMTGEKTEANIMNGKDLSEVSFAFFFTGDCT